MSTDITNIFIPAPDASWLVTVDLDGVEIQRLLGWLHPSDDDNGVGQPVIVRDTPPVTEVVEPYWSFRLEALYGISKTDANEYCDLHRDTWSELVAQRMEQARQRLVLALEKGPVKIHGLLDDEAASRLVMAGLATYSKSRDYIVAVETAAPARP